MYSKAMGELSTCSASRLQPLIVARIVATGAVHMRRFLLVCRISARDQA